MNVLKRVGIEQGIEKHICNAAFVCHNSPWFITCLAHRGLVPKCNIYKVVCMFTITHISCTSKYCVVVVVIIKVYLPCTTAFGL